MRETISGMDASTCRTENARLWVAAAGGPAEFARRYGWVQAQVSQWISPSSPKGIGHKLARDIEAKLGRPAGSMDRPPASQSVSISGATIRSAIELTRKALAASGQRHFDPEDEIDSEIVARAVMYLVDESVEVVSDSTVLQFMRAMSEKIDGEVGTPGQDRGVDRAAGRAKAGAPSEAPAGRRRKTAKGSA
jgi:hypothetical protein